MNARLLLFTLIVATSACKDNRPPAPTAGEAAQLNEAEDLLDQQANNAEGPEDRSPGPSNSLD